MGLFVLFFGTKTRYEEIAHHTIWLTERFKELLHDIFEKRIITEDFSLYIHRPTATDNSFAPDGHDSFYVLCPVPNLKNNIDWSIHGEKLKDQIITELEKTIMPNLSNHIEDISYMTPKDFKNNYKSMFGAGFSIAPKFYRNRLGLDIIIKMIIFLIYFFLPLGITSWCRFTRGLILSKSCRKYIKRKIWS